MDIETFTRIAGQLYRSRAIIELVGPPGIGKSAIVAQVCAQLSVETGAPFGLTANAVSSMASVDLRGYLFPNKEDGKLVATFSRPPFFPSRMNTRVWIDGKEQPHGSVDVPDNGIVFLDERPQADASMQKALAQVMLDRGYSDYRLPPGWAIWSAGNRAADNSGVNRTLAMLRNRIVQLDIVTPSDVWLKWASRRVHPGVLEWVAFAGDTAFETTVPREDTAFCTPRSLTILSDVLIAIFGRDKPVDPDARVYELAAGIIGTDRATKFVGFLRDGTQIVRVADILAGRASKPAVGWEFPQAVYLAAALPATPSDRATVLRWAFDELPHRVAAMFVVQLEAAQPELLLTDPVITAWIARNPRFRAEIARLR